MNTNSKLKQSKLRDLQLSPGLTRFLINLWPPYLGTGIVIEHIADDWREIRVRMRQHFYNTNIFGSHFGGSLYAMCDPYFALMLVRRLGPEYVVWDRASHIDFLLPARGTVRATFRIDDEALEQVRHRTSGGEKFEPVYCADIVNARGEIVASVRKTLYVRRKPGG